MKTQHTKAYEDTVKTMIRGNFIAVNIYIKKGKRHQVNNITTRKKRAPSTQST